MKAADLYISVANAIIFSTLCYKMWIGALKRALASYVRSSEEKDHLSAWLLLLGIVTLEPSLCICNGMPL